jgi:phospholipid-binding lipoprotein MlaA
MTRPRRLTMSAVAIALAMSVLSGASQAADKPTMNFVGSFAGSSEEAKRPGSSLLAKIREAFAADAVIEPAGVQSSTRALSPDPDSPDLMAAEEPFDVPGSLVPDVHDPFEPVNRVIFGFNEIVDFLVLRPVSHAYRTVVPQPLRLGVANALHNFASPVIFANDLLQGEPERAKTTFVRFLVNSTAGFGGMVDAASVAGLPRHTSDFGQTLALWGARPGVYMVLPLLGPSNARDTLGLVVDAGLHPAGWLMADLSFVEQSTPIMAYTVSAHENYLDELQALREISPDFYATMRDIYAQVRAADIETGAFTPGDIQLDTLPPIPSE